MGRVLQRWPREAAEDADGGLTIRIWILGSGKAAHVARRGGVKALLSTELVLVWGLVAAVLALRALGRGLAAQIAIREIPHRGVELGAPRRRIVRIGESVIACASRVVLRPLVPHGIVQLLGWLLRGGWLVPVSLAHVVVLFLSRRVGLVILATRVAPCAAGVIGVALAPALAVTLRSRIRSIFPILHFNQILNLIFIYL